MRIAQPGEIISAATTAATGLLGTLEFRFLPISPGLLPTLRGPQGIVEESEGFYVVTRQAPAEEGIWALAWWDGVNEWTDAEDLEVSGFSTTGLKPTVNDVALLMRTRTVGPDAATGGLGGDTGPQELTTFTDNTRPSSTEVERVIQTSYDSLIGSVVGGPDAVPDESAGAFRVAVALYAVTLIESSFFRDQMDDTVVRTRQDRINENLKAVNAAIQNAQGTRVPAFGTITLTTGRSPVLPTPADPMPGIDF